MFAEEEEIYSTILYKEEVGNIDYDSDLYYKLYNGVKENIEEIDDQIKEYAKDWPIKNISKIDLIILRIAIFELLVDKSNEPSIIIDEAVELAKEFGNDNSSKFIHGVLGSVIS
jgi:N utilization substance protein B